MVIRRTTHTAIECDPDRCGGRPHIAGHRIRVQDVVVWHESAGMTPDEIVNEHPGLSLADVYAALAYYHDHLDEIRDDIAADAAYVDQMRAAQPSKLLNKLIQPDGRNDTSSP